MATGIWELLSDPDTSLKSLSSLNIGCKGILSNTFSNTHQIRQFGYKLGFCKIEVDYYTQCQNPVHEMLNAMGDKKTVEDLNVILDDLDISDNNEAQSTNTSVPPDAHNSTKTKPQIEYWSKFTRQEVLEPDHSGNFDAYISCSEENEDEVMEWVTQVERGIKACYPLRDLLGGVSLPIVTPELIMYRCKWTVLFLTPEFFHSEECTFHSEIVTWVSRGRPRKKYILVKLADYENTVPREREPFNTLFSGIHRIDKTRDEKEAKDKLITSLK